MSWLIPVYDSRLDPKVCEGKKPSQKCRYLGLDNSKQLCCLKLNGDYKETIDAEVEGFIRAAEKRRKLGAHYDEDMPIGDNCPGVRMEYDSE